MSTAAVVLLAYLTIGVLVTAWSIFEDPYKDRDDLALVLALWPIFVLWMIVLSLVHIARRIAAFFAS